MENASIVTSADFAEILTSLQSQLSVGSIIEVLAYVVAAVVGLVFMWWGARKVVRMVMSAFKKGKVSI